MEDNEIIRLYWDRNEQAVKETPEKYGRYYKAIARNILLSEEDADECVNDTYLKAWNSMPPQWPAQLAAFLGKITRILSWLFMICKPTSEAAPAIPSTMLRHRVSLLL